MAPYQEEAGADELPAQPPVEAGSLPGHLLDVITKLPHTWGTKQGGQDSTFPEAQAKTLVLADPRGRPRGPQAQTASCRDQLHSRLPSGLADGGSPHMFPMVTLGNVCSSIQMSKAGGVPATLPDPLHPLLTSEVLPMSHSCPALPRTAVLASPLQSLFVCSLQELWQNRYNKKFTILIIFKFCGIKYVRAAIISIDL